MAKKMIGKKIGGDPNLACAKKNVQHVKTLGKRASKMIAVKG